jgi:Domain of unknown function (DUF4388)
VQTQGSLQESDLASLLQTMQSERATGTLSLEAGTESCSLFFLFGHLFHATGPDGDGEAVVLRALSWTGGNYHFDPRAKLPAEETIKSSPAELIAAAEEADQPAAVAAGIASATPSFHAIEGQASGVSDGGGGSTPEPSIWNPVASASDQSPDTSAAWTAPQPEQTPEPATIDSWSTGKPAPETAPAYAPAEFSPTSAPVAPAPVAAASRQSGKDSPRPAASGGPAGAAQTSSMGSLPIPSGHVQYEGLKSAFVDFPRLLRTLRGDRHTGFIRLSSGAATGVLLFRDGELVDAEAGGDDPSHGEEAFGIFRRQMDTGEGLLDVVDVDVDTVSSVARLLTGPPLFTGLLARFVNFPALLEYLAEEKLDGSVIVAGDDQTGVILLKQGGVLAAYTAQSPAPQTNTEAVAALASERSAHIEVRGDDTSREAIDAEALLSRPT